tara:strand:+ start:674 stop:1204 length:531 start_codon:yes stop_codon:yes gene_type:complete
MLTDWQVHKSNTIINYHNFFVDECHFVHENFKKTFPDKDSTWGYHYYNVFAATSPSPIWYDLYKQLRTIVREYVGTEDPLWFQSWLNFHKPDQVLDWHDHNWPYHGYISIDPKGTRTVFKDYEVKNEIGNIYIGPGHRRHKVEVDEVYDGPRITLGFDIHTEPSKPFDQWSLLPLI